MIIGKREAGAQHRNESRVRVLGIFCDERTDVVSCSDSYTIRLRRQWRKDGERVESGCPNAGCTPDASLNRGAAVSRRCISALFWRTDVRQPWAVCTAFAFRSDGCPQAHTRLTALAVVGWYSWADAAHPIPSFQWARLLLGCSTWEPNFVAAICDSTHSLPVPCSLTVHFFLHNQPFSHQLPEARAYKLPRSFFTTAPQGPTL